MYWLSVGDSKIYILREKKIITVGVEHKYGAILNEQLQNNEIDRDTYKI